MAWAQVKKKKPYADYDLRPRPMAWAQVKNPTQIMTCAPAYGLGTSNKILLTAVVESEECVF